MRTPQLPQTLRRLAVPGVLVLSLLLLLGGFYFQRQGQTVLVKPVEPPQGEVSGTITPLPIYQPSSVVSRSEFNEALEIALETEDPLPRVLEFYDKELTVQGFLQTDKAETLGSLFVKYFHSDGRVLELTLEKDGVSGKTITTLYLVSPKP